MTYNGRKHDFSHHVFKSNFKMWLNVFTVRSSLIESKNFLFYGSFAARDFGKKEVLITYDEEFESLKPKSNFTASILL